MTRRSELCCRLTEDAGRLRSKTQVQTLPAHPTWKRLEKLNLPIWTDRHPFTSASDFACMPATKNQALSLRDLWIHRMGTTGAAMAFFFLCDGRVWGVADFMTRALVKCKRGDLFEIFAMSAQSDRQARLIRALMLSIVSEEFALNMRNRYTWNRVWKIERVLTKCFAKYRHVKHHRPPWQRIASERRKDGLYELTYACEIQKGWRLHHAIKFWEDENARLAAGEPP